MANKLTKLKSFVRGDTPLLVVPVTVNGAPATGLSDYAAQLTITTNPRPTNNTDAFLHVTMATDGPNSQFTHQFTNTETELLDPTATYYMDIQINKSPAETNNFTILRGTFTVDIDFSRGLS